MKNFTKKLWVFALIVSVLSSCDLFNNNDEKETDKFLVSYEFEKAYLPDLIKLAFAQFSGTYPEIDSISAKVEHGVSVYRMTYYTSYKNELKIASGLVCVPTGEGTFPIMSYQNGTNTLHSNAPSVNPDYELFTLLEFVASTGFVVAIPDYLGFGESDDMFHPYLDRASTVKSVLDMLRATREMAENHLDISLNDDLYIAGYSQGGWATMQLQKEIEEKYMDEFNLKASACGAGLYDLSYINEYVAGLANYPMPYFLGYIFNSYVNTGDITTPIDEVFKAPYAAKISTLYDGTKSGEQINAELTTKVSDLFTADYLANSATDSKYASVVTAMEANSIAAWETEIPTLIIHGMEDDFVPTKVSTDIYQDFLAKGAAIDEVLWLPLPGLGHTTGIIPSGLASVNFFLKIKE
jgi:pimeloyl-ACP methyl ester carboxylesterase